VKLQIFSHILAKNVAKYAKLPGEGFPDVVLGAEQCLSKFHTWGCYLDTSLPILMPFGKIA
jgi:hypothetical protein